MFKNLIIASIFALTAVILGAFGAHALEEVLTLKELKSFEIAVRYQMYHAIILLFINIFDGFSLPQKNTISILFSFGIVLFSGSIYLIHLSPISAKSIWFITPLGGLFFIIGWLLTIVIFVKKMNKN